MKNRSLIETLISTEIQEIKGTTPDLEGDNSEEVENGSLQKESPADVMGAVRSHYVKMSKGHKAIADFVTEHYEEAVFMTAANIGKELSISESTVVRFATRIGYEGYPEFQDALKQYVKAKNNPIKRIDAKYGDSTDEEILQSVFASDIEKLSYTASHIDQDAFSVAVSLLLGARKIDVAGLRSCAPLAQILTFYLNTVRENAVVLDTSSMSEMFEQMIHINENDVLVGISFPRYSMRTLKAMEFANDRNAKVIAITDGIHSPMNMYSSCNLFAKSDTVSIVDSLTAAMSLINAIIASMCVKRPTEVENNLKLLEDTWNNYQVYLNDEINFIGNKAILDNPLWEQNVVDKEDPFHA